MPQKIDTRILMLTHNRVKTVISTFSRLLTTNIDNAIIYILDNGSTDTTPAYLRYLKETDKSYLFAPVLFSAENLGVSLGRKKLIEVSNERHADLEYTLFLDSDVEIINKNWLTEMIEYMKQNPQVGVGGIGMSNMKSNWESFIPAYKNPCDSVAGFCQLWRKEAFSQVQMDTQFERFWAEDSDMCFQATEKGWQVHGIPVNGIYHFPSHSGYGKELYLHSQNMDRLRKKWRGKGVILAERNARTT